MPPTLIAAFVVPKVRVAPLNVRAEVEMLMPPVPVKSAPKVIAPDPFNVRVVPAEILLLIIAIPEFVKVKLPAEVIALLKSKVVEVMPIFPELVVIAAVEIAAPFKIIPVEPVMAPLSVIAPAVPLLEVSMLNVFAPLTAPKLTAPEVPVLAELESITIAAPRTVDPLIVIAPLVVIFAFNVAAPEFVKAKVPAEVIAPLLVNVVEVMPIFPELAVVIAAVETAPPVIVNPVN